MPDIANGREKVNAFLKEKGIKKTTLAVTYGFKRQEVTNILSGTTKGPRANSFILQVIEDYGIEQQRVEEQEGIKCFIILQSIKRMGDTMQKHGFKLIFSEKVFAYQKNASIQMRRVIGLLFNPTITWFLSWW